mmetsp:Transcript_67892/g.157574  ORF Transcript_67892/g.157574 Transcript_67892/m.157574 type:complete len:368 (+) Transcript_67892:124-1227(+)
MDVVVTTVAVFPSIHLSIGAALASAAMNMAVIFGFSIFTWLNWLEPEADGQDGERTESGVPAFLQGARLKSTINVGVVGPSGSGKSSLINALRGLSADHPEAAPVGIEPTTLQPASYNLPLTCYGGGPPSKRRPSFVAEKGSPESFGPEVSMEASPAHNPSPLATEVRVWDLPGLAGHRREAYINELGLQYFDAILIVFSDRITNVELDLARTLEETYKVPNIAVRTQVDVDVESECVDHGSTEEEVLQQLKADAVCEGFQSVFLVSARNPAKYELSQLITGIASLVKARHRAHWETECPICYEPFGDDEDHTCCTCHWCGNGVCGRCARELRGRQGEAPCPFCRRWTSLAKPPLSCGEKTCGEEAR